LNPIEDFEITFIGVYASALQSKYDFNFAQTKLMFQHLVIAVCIEVVLKLSIGVKFKADGRV
jgi:hypothetical protein